MDVASVTVGVEEEFLLTDPRTGAPVPKNTEVARTAAATGIHLKLELTQCQVETNTGVHSTTAGLLRELRELRRDVAECAEKNDARLLAVALPPTVVHSFPVTDTPRFRRIADGFGMLAHEQGLCGCHVHVGVPDREIAIQVSNFLRPWLPLLLALTANSAIYRGAETGFASWRSILWQRWPSAGPPPYFTSADQYDAIVAMMTAAGCILDETMVYWDVRPSLNFPTVEIRVSDVPATVEETALLAALVRAAVVTARISLAERRTAPPVPTQTLLAAYWKAARTGIDGDGMDPVKGDITAVRELLDKLVDSLGFALKELGDDAFVSDTVATVFARGNGARRQINAFRAHRNVRDVVTELTNATLQGCE